MAPLAIQRRGWTRKFNEPLAADERYFHGFGAGPRRRQTPENIEGMDLVSATFPVKTPSPSN